MSDYRVLPQTPWEVLCNYVAHAPYYLSTIKLETKLVSKTSLVPRLLDEEMQVCIRGHKLLGGLILKESSFSFYFWWSGLNGVETAASIVKETAVTECGAHTCVSVCPLLPAAASCFSGTHE